MASAGTPKRTRRPAKTLAAQRFRNQLAGELCLRPATTAQLARFERELGRRPPPELVDLWRVHNQRNVWFGECNELLSVGESVAAARIARSSRSDWRTAWTPFAQTVVAASS